MKAKAIIHIGGHKTGTTAIQMWLKKNSPNLQKYNIFYPLELTGTPDWASGHHSIVHWLLGNQQFSNTIKSIIDDPLSYLKKQPEDCNLILSSEEFCTLSLSQIQLLKDALKKYDITLVLYTRRQDEAVQGLYQTRVFSQNYAKSFDDFFNEYAEHFDYLKILEQWKKAFPEAETVVRVYEKTSLENGNSIDDFICVVEAVTNQKIDRKYLINIKGEPNFGYPDYVTNLLYFLYKKPDYSVFVEIIKNLAKLVYSEKHGDYQIVSPVKRQAILDYFAKSNSLVAKLYLKNKQGGLFSNLQISQNQQEWETKFGTIESNLLLLIRDLSNYFEKNKMIQTSTAINDKQADVFRDKAIIEIEQGNWESALENLKFAYSIRPHGSYIRLQLVNVLVQLRRFNEVIPHLGFLNNPPDFIVKDPSTNNLLNRLRSAVDPIVNKLTYKGLHEEAKKLSIDEWIALVAKSTEQETMLESVPMPSTPPAKRQAVFHGVAGSAGIKLAAPVYKYVLHACEEQNIKPIKTLLDFGCGWGRFTRLFVRDVEDAGLIGIDPWDEALQMCRQHMPYAAFVRSQFVPPLAFRDEFFDIVFANSIFSHLSEANALLWIKEIARVLRPGGLLIATTHSKYFLQQVTEYQSGKRPCQSDWHKGFKNSKFDFTKSISSHRNGEFVFAPTGGVPNNLDYGDSFVPEEYIKNIWGEFLELVEFIDDPARFPQATFTLRKMTTVQ